ncbi:MAG: 6-carboxytetrahydropterin synthase [marine benthic group bacterium]|nr:6-carboxytetrahydropterin synthase [Gemmatimonadota bacterium]
MPIARITRRVHFSAGHRLHNPTFDAERNRATYGLCNNPNGHGHNYDLEVTVSGEVHPETGFVMDLKLLKALLGEQVLTDLDHANLNVDVDWLEDVIPTTENLAVAIWNRLDGRLGDVTLESVKIWETERNMVEYRGE